MTAARGIPRIVRLAALSAVAKGPGFLIPVLLAAFFGAGKRTDAYFLAYAGLLLVGGTVAQPLEAAVVPFAAESLLQGRAAARRFLSRWIRWAVLIGFGAGAVGALAIGVVLVGLHLTKVNGPLLLTYYLLLVPGAVGWCAAAIVSGSLTSGWRLEEAAIANAFRGLGALGGALAGALVKDLWPIAVGVSVGEWCRVYWLHTKWLGLVGEAPVGDDVETGHGFVRAATHQMGAQGLLSGAQFLERFLVGGVAVAAVSHVEYAFRLVMVASVLFDGGLAPWLLARWSNERVRGMLRSDWVGVYRLVAAGAGAALVVAAVLAGGASTIVRVLFKHGAFGADDALVVANVLRWYAFGYFLNMTNLCFERLLLARAQNRLFLFLGGARSLVRLGAVVSLLRVAGVLALPMGYLIAESVYLLTLLFASRGEVGVAVA